jgi:beta-lactamase regulating signal transducer with metallopeptidase domain
MIGTLMVHAVEAAALIGIAAALGEHAARRRALPSRAIWAAAMLGSVLLPLFAPFVPPLAQLLPSSAASIAPLARAAIDAAPQLVLDAHGDTWMRSVWIAASATMLLGLCVGAWRLSWRSRAWSRTTIDGVAVYVAANTGPAAFGLLRPRIVVPAWLAQLPARQRRLAIAHERAHLDGGDTWLLTAAFALLCAMPWNPALWWMLSRLRSAIEVDCDARVLRGGCDVAEYGETLIAVGEHRSGRSWAMAAMVPSTSFLERRIHIMLSTHSGRGRGVAATLAALSFMTVGIAAGLPAPSGSTPAAEAVGPSADATAQRGLTGSTTADHASMLDDARRLDAQRAELREQAAKLEAEARDLGERAAKQALEMSRLDAQGAKRAAEMRELNENAKKLEAEALELGAKAVQRAAAELAQRAQAAKRAAAASDNTGPHPPL